MLTTKFIKPLPPPSPKEGIAQVSNSYLINMLIRLNNSFALLFHRHKPNRLRHLFLKSKPLNIQLIVNNLVAK